MGGDPSARRLRLTLIMIVRGDAMGRSIFCFRVPYTQRELIMQRHSKTLHVEMVLHDDGRWNSNEFVEPANGVRVKSAANGKKHLALECDVASLDGFSRLLSRRNVELLKLIKEASPQSVAELARLSGRPKASLMLTLRRFKSFGIVDFDEVDGRRKVPRLACERLRLEIPIA